MKLIHSSVYSYILTEDEWYSATEQQREAWVNEITRKGAEAGAIHLAIFVQPDELLSISPIPKRHKVWGLTFPSSAEDTFYEKLMEIAEQSIGPEKLTLTQARTIARRVFG